VSKLLITQYLNQLDKRKVVSGTYRESVVIDLLARVTTVSAETAAIVEAMRGAKR
jgi:hypothetical protein